MSDPRSGGEIPSLDNQVARKMIADPGLAPPPAARPLDPGGEMPRGEMSDAVSMTGDDGATGEMPGAAPDGGAMDGAILTEMPAGAMTGGGASSARVGGDGAMPSGAMNDESPATGADDGAGSASGEMPGATVGSATAGLDGGVTLGGSWRLTFTVGNGG